MSRTDAVETGGETRAESDESTTAEISAHQSSPERIVFTESGNSDGWISIDADLATQTHR